MCSCATCWALHPADISIIEQPGPSVTGMQHRYIDGAKYSAWAAGKSHMYRALIQTHSAFCCAGTSSYLLSMAQLAYMVAQRLLLRWCVKSGTLNAHASKAHLAGSAQAVACTDTGGGSWLRAGAALRCGMLLCTLLLYPGGQVPAAGKSCMYSKPGIGACLPTQPPNRTTLHISYQGRTEHEQS